jgi:hypothetical protein
MLTAPFGFVFSAIYFLKKQHYCVNIEQDNNKTWIIIILFILSVVHYFTSSALY